MEKLSRCSHYWCEGWRGSLCSKNGAAILGLLTGWGPRNVGPWRGFFLQLQGLVLSKNSGCKRTKKMSYFLHAMHLRPSEVCIPQMLLWYEKVPHLCVDCPTPTPGPLAQQPGATDTLREAPACLNALSPNTSWCCRGRSARVWVLVCRCNHSCVKKNTKTKNPPPYLERTDSVENDCQVRWLVRACVIFSKVYFIYFL